MHFLNSCTRSMSFWATRQVPSAASGGRGLKRLMPFASRNHGGSHDGLAGFGGAGFAPGWAGGAVGFALAEVAADAEAGSAPTGADAGSAAGGGRSFATGGGAIAEGVTAGCAG